MFIVSKSGILVANNALDYPWNARMGNTSENKSILLFIIFIN